MQIRPTGPCPAKIMLVGEYPGEREVAEGQPFVGFAGQELSKMLQEAGIMRSECFITNVVRVRPPGNDINSFIAQKKSDISAQHIMMRDKFVLPVVRDGFELLKREIEMCQPNVIIAFGNVALWALTGSWGIKSWRGSVMECDLEMALPYKPKVVPAYPPAAILRQWSWRQIAIHDLRRAASQAKFREVIRPQYNFFIRPSFDQVMGVLHEIYKTLETERAGGAKHPGVTQP